MPSLAEAEQRLAQAQCHHGILRDPYGPACEQITAGKHCELQHEALVDRLTAVHRCEAAAASEMATHVKGSERELLHKMPRERERMPAGLQLAQKKRAKVSYYYVPTAPRAVPWCKE